MQKVRASSPDPLTPRATSGALQVDGVGAPVLPSSTDLDRLPVVSAPSASALSPRETASRADVDRGHSSSGVGGPIRTISTPALVTAELSLAA
jgi:hypothetical protein